MRGKRAADFSSADADASAPVTSAGRPRHGGGPIRPGDGGRAVGTADGGGAIGVAHRGGASSAGAACPIGAGATNDGVRLPGQADQQAEGENGRSGLGHHVFLPRKKLKRPALRGAGQRGLIRPHGGPPWTRFSYREAYYLSRGAAGKPARACGDARKAYAGGGF